MMTSTTCLRAGILAVAAAVLLALCTMSAAVAEPLTARGAKRAIAAAGYSGVGGVTRSGRHYFALAYTEAGRRVRVGVDIRSGAIASVVPVRRGGSLTPEPRPGRGYVPPQVDTPRVSVPDFYVPPGRTRPIGVAPSKLPSDLGVPTYCQYSPMAAGC